jgi:hypothetical protein
MRAARWPGLALRRPRIILDLVRRGGNSPEPSGLGRAGE